jgi:hypothetical protein
MAATVREAVRELLEQTMVTMDTLLAASDDELAMPSSHACAQGKDLWTLLTNDIDHEKIHTGQVLEARYESRITASPLQRLLAEWLAERARFIGSLVGLTDEQFNSETAPGEWTYRVVAKHVLMLERNSLQSIAADRAPRSPDQFEQTFDDAVELVAAQRTDPPPEALHRQRTDLADLDP